MHRRLGLALLTGLAWGQTVPDKATEIARIRENIRTYLDELPRITCTEKTRQTVRIAHAEGTETREDSCDTHQYKLYSVQTPGMLGGNYYEPNKKRTAPDWRAQLKDASLGASTGFLAALVNPQADAGLRWVRAGRANGRAVSVYAFQAAMPEGFLLAEATGSVRVPFKGLLFADAATGALAWVEIQCIEIPRESEYIGAEVTVDFGWFGVAGRELNLPAHSRVRFRMKQGDTTNEGEYSAYRIAEFGTDTRIKFGDESDSAVTSDDDSGATGAADAEPSPLPTPEPAALVTEIQKTAPPEQPLAPAPNAEAKASPPDQPAAAQWPAPGPAPDSVFRASSQLVQVSVIAQDKDGKPVADLRRDEFQIFENGTPQEIRVFLADAPEPLAAAPGRAGRAEARGTFTNRVGSGGSSVILFDKLSASVDGNVFRHNVRARQKAIEALKAIPPGERIAVYSLWCRFLVVREFTSDRDSLLEKLNAFTPGFAPCVDPKTAATDSISADPQQSDVVTAMKSREQENFNYIAFRREVELGEYEFRMMADHLAGIPGRKNLIWVTSQFSLSPANLKRLVDANVAIYPVDALGSYIGSADGKRERYDLLLAFAGVSGGVAFYDRDDLDTGIREAVRDGLVSYTLGFYPASEDTKAPVHQLRVRVSRPGVTLRYRKSYALKPQPSPSTNPVADLVQALNRPVDATVIPITANATRNRDHMDLSVVIDVPSLDPELNDGLWKTQAELVMRFVTADGLPAGDVSAQTLTFNLKPATYESMQKGGEPYRSHSDLQIPAKAVELKVLVGNPASGKIGTLTIPLSELAPSPSNPK
jgi:VWFA-related protein